MERLFKRSFADFITARKTARQSRGAAKRDADVSLLYNPEVATMKVNRKANPDLLLMLLFLGTFDVQSRNGRALLRRKRLLRLVRKQQKMQVFRMK